MTDRRTAQEALQRLIADVPDWPQDGVTFKVITAVLADHTAFTATIAALSGPAGEAGGVDKALGMEARGFILAAPVALALGAGFVPVRKAGKLPGPTLAASYALEYGAATVEVHPDTIPGGARVLVLDDVLATGGTAAATAGLVEEAGGVVVGLAFLLELTALSGRARLTGRHVEALLTTP